MSEVPSVSSVQDGRYWRELHQDALLERDMWKARAHEYERVLREIRHQATRVEKGPPFRLPQIRDLVDETIVP